MRLFHLHVVIAKGKHAFLLSTTKVIFARLTIPSFNSRISRCTANPKYWVRPDDFLPERWLVPAGHELHHKPNAWRPFESGPRNCIAQASVLTELRITLACLIRVFNITPADDEYDAKHPRKGIQTCKGERAYLTERGAAHPTAGYPYRIALVG
jgi:hypothetical protein